MTSINNFSNNIAISNTDLKIVKQNENKESLVNKQENKINISIKKDNVQLQSFLKGGAISSVSILAGVKFASSFSPGPKAFFGGVAIAVGTGVIGGNLLKGKESSMEKVVAGASITGGIIGYVIANKIGEGGPNGLIAGMAVGGLVGIAAGKIMEKKTEEKK